MDNVVDAVNEIDPDLLIIDSIQTFTMENSLPARADLLRKQWSVLMSC